MIAEIIPARLEHVQSVAMKLRGVSAVEVERSGVDSANAIKQAVTESRFAWTGTVDGEVACMWGIGTPSLLSDQAVLWMVTTELVEDHAFLFIRKSQIFMQELIKHFTIYGTVRQDFHRSIRWLRWLGFTVFPAKDGVRPFRMDRV